MLKREDEKTFSIEVKLYKKRTGCREGITLSIDKIMFETSIFFFKNTIYAYRDISI